MKNQSITRLAPALLLLQLAGARAQTLIHAGEPFVRSSLQPAYYRAHPPAFTALPDLKILRHMQHHLESSSHLQPRCPKGVSIHETVRTDVNATHVELCAKDPCGNLARSISKFLVTVKPNELTVEGVVREMPFKRHIRLPHNNVARDKITATYTHDKRLRVTLPTENTTQSLPRSVFISRDLKSSEENKASPGQDKQYRQSIQQIHPSTSIQGTHPHQRQESHVAAETQSSTLDLARASTRHMQVSSQGSERWAWPEPPIEKKDPATAQRKKDAQDEPQPSRPHKSPTSTPSSQQTQRRKEYVRAPRKECVGRYCRQHWQGSGTTNPQPHIEADIVDVLFDNVDNRGTGDAHKGQTTDGVERESMEAILKGDPLDVEAYVKAIENELARIKSMAS